MLLATIMHPVLAAIVAIIFNADLFYEFQVWKQAAIHSGNTNIALRMLEHVFHSLYILLPMFYPFASVSLAAQSRRRSRPSTLSCVRQFPRSSSLPPGVEAAERTPKGYTPSRATTWLTPLGGATQIGSNARS
jgi:hypothetical protein